MKSLLSLIGLMAFTATAYSQSWTIGLNWSSSPAAELVTNYVVYQATGTNDFLSVATTPTNSVAFTNVQPGLYRYRVTAQNAWGEGPASAEVATPVGLPTAPYSVTINITINGTGTVNILNRSLKR